MFDALQALELPGRAIYELRLHEEGTQVDFALWLDRLGRFALQVKGGRNRLEIWPESLFRGDEWDEFRQ